MVLSCTLAPWLHYRIYTTMRAAPDLSFLCCFVHSSRDTRKGPLLYQSSGNRGVVSSSPMRTLLFGRTGTIVDNKKAPIRIGIVGGGIAGVSVAHALATRHPQENIHISIIEGDQPNPGQRWVAATARNANSLVPGVSMHVFSSPSVIFQVLNDTMQDWFDQMFNKPAKEFDFAKPPPYFALHMLECLRIPEQRWTFLNFGFQFLYSCIKGGAAERGRLMHQLAAANRAMYLEMNPESSFGHSKGFLSLFRSQNAAEASARDTELCGEQAALVPNEQDLVELEPSLKRFPIPVHGVHRQDDYTASCEQFVASLIETTVATGTLDYTFGKVKRVESIPKYPTRENHRFLVTSDDGTVREYDILVLAAGAATPLFATQLGASNYCPTFPLRGFSLTISLDEKDKRSNALKQPFTVDSMYFTSVSSESARIAGFGEFVGYRENGESVPSRGPAVLSKYAKQFFPNARNAEPENVLACYRPMSPDDLPIAGEVPLYPGLFLHTGHGTLGWTCGLATGHCVAQAIVDRIHGHNTQEGTFALANETHIKRYDLSPRRFVG